MEDGAHGVAQEAVGVSGGGGGLAHGAQHAGVPVSLGHRAQQLGIHIIFDNPWL